MVNRSNTSAGRAYKTYPVNARTPVDARHILMSQLVFAPNSFVSCDDSSGLSYPQNYVLLWQAIWILFETELKQLAYDELSGHAAHLTLFGNVHRIGLQARPFDQLLDNQSFRVVLVKESATARSYPNWDIGEPKLDVTDMRWCVSRGPVWA